MRHDKYLFPGVTKCKPGRRAALGGTSTSATAATNSPLSDTARRNAARTSSNSTGHGLTLSKCKMIIATHADADHSQGCPGPRTAKTKTAPIRQPRRIGRGPRSKPCQHPDQDFHIPMRRCKIDRKPMKATR